MKKLILILLALCMVVGVGYSQVPVKRKKTQKTEQPQSSDNSRKQEAEAKRKQEEEARQQREAEAKRKETGMINGHEWVDLGLPSGLKWATCNVGASSPSDYGDYYAWGETATKSSYDESNSLTYGKSISELRSAGIIGASGKLTMKHDAARANWGGSWRMPTKKEYEELKDKCTWTWTTQGGRNGYEVTGPNGRSIFLPTTGWRQGTSLYNPEITGGTWSSVMKEGSTDLAYHPYFNRSERGCGVSSRSDGFTVRPVSE